MRIARTILVVGLWLASFWVGGPCRCSASSPGKKSNIVYDDTIRSHDEGARFFHYFNDVSTECYTSAVIIGVGTAMARTDYNLLALDMVNELDDPQALLVIVDPVPHNPIKLYPKPFARAINRLVAQLHEVELSSSSTIPHHFCPDKNATVIVGGHSASGSAAFYGSKFFDFPVAGFLGLDPFPIQRRHHHLSIPALYWGFSGTTCGVSVSHAAMAAFDVSESGQRVLYQIQNDEKKRPFSGMDCQYSHCDFTDSGCFVICPMQCSDAAANDLRHDVAVSLRLFLKAIKDGGRQRSFSRSHFASDDFRMDSSLFLDENEGEEVDLGTRNHGHVQHGLLVA